MLRVPQQRVDPALGAVVGREIVVEEQLAEREPAADVGEGPEGEDAVGRLDELRDVGVLVEDLLDDRADRLVDQRNPELVEVGHARIMAAFDELATPPGTRRRSGARQRACAARVPVRIPPAALRRPLRRPVGLLALHSCRKNDRFCRPPRRNLNNAQP